MRWSARGRTGRATRGRAAALRSLEHVGLGFDQQVVDRLKMQPADEIITHVLTAVPGARIRHKARLDAGRLDQQLHLAAPLEGDEPESSIVDTVPARRD